MPVILDRSPISRSSPRKHANLPACLLDSLSSVEGSRSDQENEMPTQPQFEHSKVKSREGAALEGLDLGQLTLSDGPQKAQKDVQALEDSDSEHSAVMMAQPNGCLLDSDASEEQVAVSARAPLDHNEPVVDLLSGSEDEEDEENEHDAAGQQSGAEALRLEADGSMAFCLRAGLHDALYVHQGKGGILGDDMGLGKTRTMSSFLAGLTPVPGSSEASRRNPHPGTRRFRRGIVVVPTTLIDTWMTELDRVGIHAIRYHGTKRQRERLQSRIFTGFKVAVTTYETMLNDADVLSSCSDYAYFPEDHDQDIPAWDMIVLDEGHKVKNFASKTYQALHSLPVRMRVVVTGTPMQNNLMEMHALLDLACPGLLPDRKQFKLDANIIEAGQDKSAPLCTKQRGHACTERLHALFDPYLLRRNKASTRLITVATTRINAASDGSGDGMATGAPTEASDTAAEPDTPALPGKTDLVVWLQLHPVQKQAYQGFLGSAEVQAVFNQTSSALAAISVLKKICDHPALLNNRNALKAVRMPRRQPPLGGDKRSKGAENSSSQKPHQKTTVVSCDDDSEDDFAQPTTSRVAQQPEYSDSEEDDLSSMGDFVVQDSDDEIASEGDESDDGDESDEAEVVEPSSEAGASGAAVGDCSGDWSSMKADDMWKRLKDMHVEDSCKTVFTLKLIQQLAATGHRTLVFAQSLGMLDMLQRALCRSGMRVLRMDGQSAAVADRQKIVARFQKSKSIPVFLLSAQVGGLGLTITAADRVIILDPSWNPAVDCQSVDRAFRIGQRRHVVVYRLITCGTVEEKIYRRQVFKGGLAKATIEKANPTKYFSEVELRELFSLDISRLSHSHTAEELHKHHAADRDYPADIASHVASLTEFDCAVDTSDHSVLFSRVDESASDSSSAAQQLPIHNPQAACNDDTASTSRAAPVAAAAIGSTVATGVQPLSAQALQRKKLSKKASALEQRISDVTAALSATQGGSVLADNGAKLHAALRTANDELAATHAALKAAVEGHAEPAVATPLGGVKSKSSCSSTTTRDAMNSAAMADALADLLSTQATLKDKAVSSAAV